MGGWGEAAKDAFCQLGAVWFLMILGICVWAYDKKVAR